MRFMQKLLVCLSIVLCLAAYRPDGRFDFEDHQGQFMDGDCKIKAIENDRKTIKTWTVIFKDGCEVKWVTDMEGRILVPFHWVKKRNHGVKA